MRLQGLVVLACLDVGLDLPHNRLQARLSRQSLRLLPGRALQLAPVVGVQQLDHPAVQVAEVVGQVRVVDIAELLPAELAIAGERTFTQEVVAERFRVELRDDVHRLDDVAERFADLLDVAGVLILDVNEAVAEHLARRLDARRKAHGRPQGAVEAA